MMRTREEHCLVKSIMVSSKRGFECDLYQLGIRNGYSIAISESSLIRWKHTMYWFWFHKRDHQPIACWHQKQNPIYLSLNQLLIMTYWFEICPV